MKCIVGVGVACLSLIVSANVVVADTLLLNGVADGDSTYIESGSDGFIRVDLYDPGDNATALSLDQRSER